MSATFSPEVLDIARALDIISTARFDATCAPGLPFDERVAVADALDALRTDAVALETAAEARAWLARVHWAVTHAREAVARAGGRLSPLMFSLSATLPQRPVERMRLAHAENVADTAPEMETHDDGRLISTDAERDAAREVDVFQMDRSLEIEEAERLLKLDAALDRIGG